MDDADDNARGQRVRPIRVRLAVAATAIAALVFVAGTVAAPLLERAGSPAGTWLRSLYAPSCHQNPERSLTFAGSAQAVCARCTGLYVGGLTGVLVGGIVAAVRGRIRPVWLAWAFAPSLVDVGLRVIGLPSLSNVPRLLLAVPAGFVVGVFLAIAVCDLAGRERRATPPVSASVPVNPRDI